MAVICRKLLALPAFKKLTLLAGEEGLDRIVTWPYIGQTTTVSNWVHGGEMLFITGLVHSSYMLPALLEECIANNLSGLVILTGSEYIKEIPEEVVIRANEMKFPVFSMPWELKLIDVTREITDLLMYDQMETKKMQQLLSHLLFAPEDEVLELADKATLHSIALKEFNFISIFSLSEISLPDSKASREDQLQQQIVNLSQRCKCDTYTMICSNYVVVLSSCHTQEDAASTYSYMESIRDVLAHICNDVALTLALGDIHEGILSIRKSYKEAMQTLHVMRKVNSTFVGHYKNLGIYRLLLHVKGRNELSDYYQSQLMPIIEYDKKNESNFMLTLKTYLQFRCNTTKTAQILFIHRNTLIYRINKIEELLQKKVEDPLTSLELQMAILIMEYLEK